MIVRPNRGREAKIKNLFGFFKKSETVLPIIEMAGQI